MLTVNFASFHNPNKKQAMGRTGEIKNQRTAEDATFYKALPLQSNHSIIGGKMLEEGSQAPQFSAPDQHGNMISLEDFSGKWIALWWYPKASTPG